jgi:deazaflavin-dependent oxidoreductase (nitroreductase family)
MAVPRWMAHVNKRVFNPIELRKAKRPVLTHVGRTSGSTYRTPMDAHPIDDGFLFFAMYTSRSDWVRNVLAAGSATVTAEGIDTHLVNPRLVSEDEARALLPDTTPLRPGKVKGIEYLRMDVA